MVELEVQFSFLAVKVGQTAVGEEDVKVGRVKRVEAQSSDGGRLGGRGELGEGDSVADDSTVDVPDDDISTESERENKTKSKQREK